MEKGNGRGRGVQRVKRWLMDYAYLVTIFAVLAVVAGSAMYTQEVTLGREAAQQAAAQAAEIAASPERTKSPAPTLLPLVLSQPTRRPWSSSVRPVEGEIIRAYEAEPVYWPALGVIKAHPAIDIAGEKEESVRSAMDGTVTHAAMDALWGWRVTVAHTDGSECVYAGLALCCVTPGQHVSRGEELGVLMEAVPCERELGAHLHLEWTKNGVAQDPEGMLPER